MSLICPFRSLVYLFAAICIATASVATVEEGSIQSRTIFSSHLGKDLTYEVYLPPGYTTKGTTRYPTLYLLHGRGDNMTAWAVIKTQLDQLIIAGRIPALIAIMPDAPSSKRAGYYIDSEFAGTANLPAGERVETAFTSDLVNQIDALYPTQPDRTGRVVAGYSMGGYGALRYALVHPEIFSAALILSPAVYFPLPPPDSSTREFGAFGRGHQLFDDALYQEKNYPATIPVFESKKLPLILFIAVGDDEHALTNPAESSHDLDYEAHTLYNRIRRAPGITAQFRVVDGGHNWSTWRPTFVEGIQYVFRQLKPPATSAPTSR